MVLTVVFKLQVIELSSVNNVNLKTFELIGNSKMKKGKKSGP